jgi:hypothetical protein
MRTVCELEGGKGAPACWWMWPHWPQLTTVNFVGRVLPVVVVCMPTIVELAAGAETGRCGLSAAVCSVMH